jgi:hypothetical protein
MRTLRKVALVAAAVMALAGAAQASAASFTAPKAGEAFTNKTTTQHVFTITGQQVKCAVSNFTGVTEGSEAEGAGKVHNATMTVHPNYKECTAFGFPATIDTTPTTEPENTSCHYTLSAATDAAGMGSVAVVGCTAKASTGAVGIVITVSVAGVANCEVVVPNQTIASAVSYTNVAGATPATVDVTATAVGIEANVVKSTGLCPLTVGVHKGTTGAAVGATYTGTQDISSIGGFTYTP